MTPPELDLGEYPHLSDAERERRRRLQTILTLLDHWRDFFDEPADPAGAATGEGPLAEEWTLFSTMGRYPSVLELVRCLGVLERMGPAHYKHLMAYSARVEWRQTVRELRRKDQRGRWVTVPVDVRERLVPRWVVLRMVELGLDFVRGVWCSGVPLELPPGLTLKLTTVVHPETGEEVWTEQRRVA